MSEGKGFEKDFEVMRLGFFVMVFFWFFVVVAGGKWVCVCVCVCVCCRSCGEGS